MSTSTGASTYLSALPLVGCDKITKDIFELLQDMGAYHVEVNADIDHDHATCTLKLPLSVIKRIAYHDREMRGMTDAQKEQRRISRMPHEFRIRIDSEDGGHVHFTIFSGKQEYTGANCGSLCMNHEEFKIFSERLSYLYKDGEICKPVFRDIKIKDEGLQL